MHAIIIVQLPYKAKCVKNIKKKQTQKLHAPWSIYYRNIYAIYFYGALKKKSFHIYKNKRQVKIYKVSLVSCK